MSHFSPGLWVDSVRGLLSGPQAFELQSHLDTNCPACRQTYEFWTHLNAVLRQESRFTPPPELVRVADDLYAPNRPWKWLKAAAHWAELAFDSLRQPSLAFVRGLPRSERHLIYHANPFIIDVRLKSEGDQNNLSMFGQVLRFDLPEQTDDSIYVVLLSGGELVARTLAGRGGEFSMQCETKDDLSLFISVRGERAIGISISESLNSQAAL